MAPASLAFVIPWAKIGFDKPIDYFEMACQSGLLNAECLAAIAS